MCSDNRIFKNFLKRIKHVKILVDLLIEIVHNSLCKIHKRRIVMLQSLTELDGNILLFVQDNLRNEILNDIVVWFTSLGNAGLVWIFIVLAFIFNKKTHREGMYCALSLILCFILVNLFLKNAVARIRPYDAMEQIRCLIGPQHDYSFPSGHTAIAFAASVPVFIILNKTIGSVMIVFSVLMGLSRIYICVHYPTDVICGVIAGTLCGFVVCVVYKRHIAANKQQTYT